MGLIRRFPWALPLLLFIAMGLLGLAWPYEPGQDVDISQAYASPSAASSPGRKNPRVAATDR